MSNDKPIHQGGASFFSMLSPDEWGGRSPNDFLGSYRLETDYSWTPAAQIGDEANTSDLVTELLRIGGQHQFTEQT